MRGRAAAALGASVGFAHRDALSRRPALETILEAVRRRLSPAGRAEARWWRNPASKMAEIHLLREVCGLSLAATAARYGMGATAVCQAQRRFKMRLAQDPELAASVRGLQTELGGMCEE